MARNAPPAFLPMERAVDAAFLPKFFIVSNDFDYRVLAKYLEHLLAFWYQIYRVRVTGVNLSTSIHPFPVGTPV